MDSYRVEPVLPSPSQITFSLAQFQSNSTMTLLLMACHPKIGNKKNDYIKASKPFEMRECKLVQLITTNRTKLAIVSLSCT